MDELVTTTSDVAAFGHAHARLAQLLDEAGHPAPYDAAREYLEELRRDGWRWRYREPVPPHRVAPAEATLPTDVPAWAAAKADMLARVREANARFEEREAAGG